MTESIATPSRYDVGVLIGRFEPFHSGHLALLSAALQIGRTVVVVIGSAFQAPTPKNPFTWQQRADMMRLCLAPADLARVQFLPVRDYYDDTRWVRAVQTGVADKAGCNVQGANASVVLIGHEKDDSSYYLQRFQSWHFEALGRQHAVDATTIRQVLFTTSAAGKEAALTLLRDGLPEPVRHYLSAWFETPLHETLSQEYAWLNAYRRRWTADVYLTADSVVTCQQHVLLIERSQGQGAGQLALPGGFLEKNERFLAAARRELLEETDLGVYSSLLEASLRRAAVFDHPQRSQRGRIITVAHLFELGESQLPDIRGRDDARRAMWVPICELASMEDRFFEDHFHILDDFFGLTAL